MTVARRERQILEMHASTMIRRTRVEVDLGAIVANARAVHALCSGAEVYAVVKADAYGHGAVAVAQALTRAKAASGFAVSLVEEGVALREAGVTAPVLVMGPSQHGGEDEMVMAGLTPVIGSAEDLDAIAAVAQRRQRSIEAHLKVDTGMGRLGVAVERAAELARMAANNGVQLVGLMTHFACADTDDPADPQAMTRAQLAAVRRRRAGRGRRGRADPDPARGQQLGRAAVSGRTVRPGADRDRDLRQRALAGRRDAGPRRCGWSPRSRSCVDRRGSSVGYGAAWRAARDSRLAVLPVGYADGLPRRASGHAEVAIRGQRVPLVGGISMDIAIADVTDVPDIAVGDRWCCSAARRAGPRAISTAEYGHWAGLSEYEVTCGMSKRVPRTYVGAPP